MPKKGNGQSLKSFTVSGWFGKKDSPGETIAPFEVKASSLVGAVGRGAREARKLIPKGRYTLVTINVE